MRSGGPWPPDHDHESTSSDAMVTA